MNIRKLEDLSKKELVELLKQERETCGHQIIGIEQDGMTLRDCFAAIALAAILSGPERQLLEMKTIADNNGVDMDSIVAYFSYKRADAMIAQREKQE